MGSQDPQISSAPPLTAEQLKLRGRMAGRLITSELRVKQMAIRRPPGLDQQQPQSQQQEDRA